MKKSDYEKNQCEYCYGQIVRRDKNCLIFKIRIDEDEIEIPLEIETITFKKSNRYLV